MDKKINGYSNKVIKDKKGAVIKKLGCSANHKRHPKIGVPGCVHCFNEGRSHTLATTRLA